MNYFFTVFKLEDILSLKIFLIQFLHKWACEYRKTCCMLLNYALFYSFYSLAPFSPFSPSFPLSLISFQNRFRCPLSPVIKKKKRNRVSLEIYEHRVQVKSISLEKHCLLSSFYSKYWKINKCQMDREVFLSPQVKLRVRF